MPRLIATAAKSCFVSLEISKSFLSPLLGLSRRLREGMADEILARASCYTSPAKRAL